MKNALFFEIPSDTKIRARLIMSIPSNWGYVNGSLAAPEIFITSANKAVADTGYFLSRFSTIKPIIVGSYNRERGQRNEPDLFAIMVEQKLPGFVSFDNVGYDGFSLEIVKKITAGFIKMGYTGGLHFYRNRPDDEITVYCGMIFEKFTGGSFLPEEVGPQPSRIKLQWDEKNEETKIYIEPIEKICRILNLRQYEPQGQATF